MAGTGATASQAWAILKRHARDEISPLRLKELCRDNDRVSSLVAVYNATPDRILLADLSRQRLSLETLNHLLRLATARGIKKYITKLAWGQNDPDNPVIPLRLRQKQLRQGQHHRAVFVGEDRKKATRFEEADEAGGGKHQHSNSASAPSERSAQSILIPSFHLSLRAPRDQGLEMLTADGLNALTEIHREWGRIERISESLRRGQLPGVTGNMIRDVVVVGRGVPMMALRFVYLALLKDETAAMGSRAGLGDASSRRRGGIQGCGYRRIKFLTTVDPVRQAAVVADLDPACTIVISLALSGIEETDMATRTMRSWLLKSLGNGRRQEVVLSKHMMFITGNERIAAAKKPESVFLIPDHSRCEAFTSFTAATLLPLSIVFGWPIVEQFLAGAHNLDCHFVETNPRHNLPVLLALTDVWNDTFLGSSGRVVTPFTEAFAAYPAFCASIEAEACGNSSNKSTCSSLVIDGGLHNSYDRALYQTSQVIPSELVMTLDTQISANAALGLEDEVKASQDALFCSLFAHADEMAFGTDIKSPSGFPTVAGASPLNNNHDGVTNGETEISEGNRPSTVLLCGKCDAFTCGQLIALAEHRVVVKARILDVDPFCREVGSSLRFNRTEKLKEELQTMFDKLRHGDDMDDDEDNQKLNDGQGMSLSTKTILGHYANLMRDQRIYVAKS